MHSWGDTCKAGLDFPPGRSGSPEAENWICGEATLPFMLSVPQAEELRLRILSWRWTGKDLMGDESDFFGRGGPAPESSWLSGIPSSRLARASEVKTS